MDFTITTTRETNATQQLSATSPASIANKISYSQPGSPTPSPPDLHNNDSGYITPPSTPSSTTSSNSDLSTPKKNLLDAVTLQTIREKLLTPGGASELQSLCMNSPLESTAINVVKQRYVICAKPKYIPASAFANTPSCYRHLVDMNMCNLKCTDIYTGEQFLCKIINEPLHKVQEAYFKLKQDSTDCLSSIHGHLLIRDIKDLVYINNKRTYIILAAPKPVSPCDTTVGVFEDLHTYLRDKHRLEECEARSLFHQICETVLICHRNGIVLRDLKLKRFFFVDKERTKLQYESLEGSMILDNPADDTLCEKIGCPLYTAPELLCPDPTYSGKPADMWALGVILYTMLVGQYPFYEKGNCNLITIIRQCFVQLPSYLSRSVRWLLLSLLRKNIPERMPIEHVFLSPWLKEEKPYYMYIPVDSKMSEDEDDYDYDDDEGFQDNSTKTMMSLKIDEDDGVQPLDYSCTTLSMSHDSSITSYAAMGMG